jgi:uncharacterized membrane protein
MDAVPVSAFRFITVIIQNKMQIVAGSFFLLITVISLWRASTWQNSLRELMGMEADAFVQHSDAMKTGSITSILS